MPQQENERKGARVRKEQKHHDRAHSELEADTAFYKQIIDDASKLVDDSGILLNIPVWGYPNHGKTTAILTALLHCEPDIHGISLAIVNDPDDLSKFSEKEERYRTLNLPALAKSTREVLSDMLEQFLKKFPDATELPSQFLLELQATAGRLGYVILPDIKGGSYESVDDVAKNATENSHALVMVIDPAYYNGPSANSIIYRKEVLRRLQHSSASQTPTCVMISMADKYGEPGDAADKTEKELEGRIAQQKNKELFYLARVTALGIGVTPGTDGLPAKDARNPRALVRAWTWTLNQALGRPRAAVAGAIPRTDLHAAVRPRQLHATSLPELRVVALNEQAPLHVLCAAGTGNERFLAVADGMLAELTIDVDANKHHITPLCKADEAFDPANLHARYADGALFASTAQEIDEIWHAPRGQIPTRIGLPQRLQAWAPVDSRRLVGVAPNGTLVCLQRQDAQWAQLSYIPGFCSPGKHLVCGYLEGDALVVILDGSNAPGGVGLSSKGTFTDRRSLPIAVRFDTGLVELSSAGFVAAELADRSLVAGREQMHTVGTCHNEWSPSVALANAFPVVAWIAPDKRLRAARIDGKKIVQTADSTGALIEEEPSTITWSESGRVLLVGYASGHWQSLRRLGF